MEIEILIKKTGVMADSEIAKVREMQNCVKNKVPYKDMELTEYEALNLGTKYAMPFDAIIFKGTM